MNVFKNIFQQKNGEKNLVTLQKGEKLISTNQHIMYKIIREVSDNVSGQIEKSTLLISISQLYMHYMQKDLKDEPNNPEWENQSIFFWRAEEPFPQKSLPPAFQSFPQHFFIVINSNKNIHLNQGKTMPWFGMQGGGTKYFFTNNQNEKVKIANLKNQNLIQYVQFVDVNDGNTDVLFDKENYLILVDERIVKFNQTNFTFYLDGKPIPFHIAYQIGGMHIIKKI